MKHVRFARTALPLLVALAAPATSATRILAQQQTDNSFKWSGHIPAGRMIRVRSLNGPITVAAANGDNVEVTATKRWRRGDPSVVHIDAKKYGAGDENVVICALWGDDATCDERGYDSHSDSRRDPRLRNNDVSVEFRVLVPKGVNVAVSTVNGDVQVDGATADVDAGTVNGEVDITTSGGRARATNVNGGVRARLGRLESDASMQFTTVNGNVTVEFTGDSGADLDMSTVNGTLNTNFEMTLQGRLDPKRLRSHVGPPGGPRIRLSTVNGSVDIRRR
jgi:hypothetical protein